MKTKEKATELVERFLKYAYTEHEAIDVEETAIWNAKQCALICVDEILTLSWLTNGEDFEKTWKEIKQEIKEL